MAGVGSSSDLDIRLDVMVDSNLDIGSRVPRSWHDGGQDECSVATGLMVLGML